MNALTRHSEELPLNMPQSNVTRADAGTMMEVIARAAENPNVDVDKLERLLGVYERITERSAEQSYNDAMNAAQQAMRPVAADASNPQTKSKYASYAALDRALRPIYTRHGFSLSFDTADGAPAEHVRVVCKVGHRDGHKQLPHLDMPADGKGAKGADVMTKTHAIGAAITYGKRYLLGMIFNIAVGGDDDGNSNGGHEPSAAVSAATAAMNACNTLDGLKAWKLKNKALIEAMSPADANLIIRAVNDRVSRLRGGEVS